MNIGRSARRLAAVGVIGLVAATGCSTGKTASSPPSQSVPASSTPTVSGGSIDLSGFDRGLGQIDTEVSGANTGLNSTSEGDVQTQ